MFFSFFSHSRFFNSLRVYDSLTHISPSTPLHLRPSPLPISSHSLSGPISLFPIFPILPVTLGSLSRWTYFTLINISSSFRLFHQPHFTLVILNSVFQSLTISYFSLLYIIFHFSLHNTISLFD